MDIFYHEIEVDRRHDKIADKRSDGRAGHTDFRYAEQNKIDQKLCRRTTEHGNNRLAFQLMCLKNRGRDRKHRCKKYGNG